MTSIPQTTPTYFLRQAHVKAIRASCPAIDDTIYFAAPITTYNDDRYDLALARLANTFPKAIIVSVREAFRSSFDWLQRGRDVLAQCTVLVFITDTEGFIGLGVDTEITHASEFNLPVFFFRHDGRLLSLDKVRFSKRTHDGRQYRKVIGCNDGP